MSVMIHVARSCAVVLAAILASLQPAGAHSIPVWRSSFTFGGSDYTIQLVGANPSRGGTTTLIANTIVPMRIVFPDGNVLDARNDVAPLIASPIYSNAAFPSGSTQYADAVLRAELWQAIAGQNYHVLLDTPTVESDYLLIVPNGYGFTRKEPNGKIIGTVDYDWFVKTVQPSVIAQLGIAPTSLTIFLTRNLLLKRPGNSCCYHGNHTAFYVRVPAGRDHFTTVWAGVNRGDVETMSHEVNEWANDPYNDNAVPPWKIPDVDDCNKFLEVGDPLIGVKFSAGGYVLQDAAYVEWFSRQMPSMALGGRYDFLGRFKTVAHSCDAVQVWNKPG